MASKQKQQERYSFTVEDEGVQDYLDSADNKSGLIRAALLKQVYGDESDAPDGLEEMVWDSYQAWVNVFGTTSAFEFDEVASGLAAETNKPTEVQERRIKRLISLGYAERMTTIERVTVRALPMEDVVGDDDE